jgi:hypothetical protein
VLRNGEFEDVLVDALTRLHQNLIDRPSRLLRGLPLPSEGTASIFAEPPSTTERMTNSASSPRS